MREISALLASRIQDLAPDLVGALPTSKSRLEWRFRSRGALAVVIVGPDRGQWFDHEVGTGGDAIDLVCHLRACNRRGAWHWARTWLGQSRDDAPSIPSAVPRDTSRTPTDLPRVIWTEAAAAQGSPVELYFRSRGLHLPPEAPLRFHPACPRGPARLPAMIGLMTDPANNQPTGIHRTFLAPNGSGKADVTPAKMMLGAAGVIRLSPDDTVTRGLGICEGIENGAAILEHVGWAPIWAAGSAGGIARFPLLPGIECLTVFADADDQGAGLRAAHGCAERWYAAGREVAVQLPPAGADWLDALEASNDT